MTNQLNDEQKFRSMPQRSSVFTKRFCVLTHASKNILHGGIHHSIKVQDKTRGNLPFTIQLWNLTTGVCSLFGYKSELYADLFTDWATTGSNTL